jgi:hypothetical protein
MTNPNVTRIPLPGGSGRVPTGAMQFQDDWPGLFLRGDTAIFLMARIRILAERLGNQTDMGIVSVMYSLKELADLIDRDVKVR